MTNPYAIKLNEIKGSQGNTLAPLGVSAPNPYQQKIANQGQTTDDQHENDTGFFHTVGSFLKYLPTVGAAQDKLDINKADAQSQIEKNIQGDLSAAFHYYQTTPVSQVLNDTKSWIASGFKDASISPGSIATGLFKGFIEKPVEALTYTVNDNGTARPASAMDEANAMQSVAGTVAQMGTFSKLKTSFLGDIPEGEAAVSAMTPKAFGAIPAKLAQAGKFVGSESLAGGISGGVQAGIAGIGQDDQAQQIIAGALSFMPVSAAMSLFGIKGYLRETAENAETFKSVSTLKSTHELAALNSMRINPQDPMSNLVAGIDAVNGADQMTYAAINFRLNNKDGYVVEGVGKDLGNELGDRFLSSYATKPSEITLEEANKLKDNGEALPPNTYVINSELRKPRPRPNSTEIKFDSSVDKIAYLAAKKDGMSPFVQKLVDDLSNQTGLTEDEIIRHGQYVRQQQKADFQTGQRLPRNQAEIDAYNQASIENGKAKILALPDGGKVSDSNGVEWTRNGNNLVDIKSGQSLPVDQTNTQQILGRKVNDTPFYQPYQQLKVQQFSPNFGRDIPSEGNRYYYSGKTGNLLVSSKDYTPDQVEFFKDNGFLKNEIVNHQGLDYSIKGVDSNGMLQTSNIISGKRALLDPLNVRRTNYSLDLNKVSDRSFQQPVLNPDILINKLYTNFKESYDAAPETQSFSGTLSKFFSDNKIEAKDQTHIASLLTKKLSDDLSVKTLTPDEYSARQELIGKFGDLADDIDKDHDTYLSNQALSNNLFFSSEGAGKYRLRFQDSGKTYAVVGSPKEAMDAINKIRQSNGLDADGGYTGAVPTGVANLGGLTQKMTPLSYGRFEQAVDLSRAGGFLGKFSPMFRVAQSIDNLTQGKTSFSKSFLDMQESLINRRNIIQRDPIIRDIAQKGQDLLNFGKSIKSDRRMLLADNAEAMTIDQIKNEYLNRHSTPLEEALAQEVIASKDVGSVQDLLYKTRMSSPNASVGGQAFMTLLNQLGTKYTPEVTKAAGLFSMALNKVGQQINGPLVLKLASALENPDLAIDAKTHAKINKITPIEQLYINKYKKWMSTVSPLVGIDPQAKFQMSLPDIVRYVSANQGDIGMNADFGQELSRVGITPRNELIRDPNQLMTKYFTSLVNYKSGFQDALKEYEKSTADNITNLKGTKLEPASSGLQQKFEQYQRQVSGYPDPSDALHKSIRQVANSIGIKSFDQNSVLSLMSLGLIAGRPILAIRDFHNIMALSYTSFGLEFTKKAFADATNPEYVQWMKDNNLLPESSAKSMIDPAADEGQLIAENSWIKKWSDKGFQLSGQEFSYEHANAGVYKASMEMGEKYFEQMRKGTITKDQAYDKMGISSNYGPGVIQLIDDYVTQGRTDLAADLYAQANMRFVSHVYGFHNNPMGWQTGWGRLLSQWGSWSANASQTMIDQVSRGTKNQIAGKLSRGGIVNLATVGAGAAMGFNLGGWMVSNPLTVWPTAGAAVSTINDLGEQVMSGQLSLGGMIGKEVGNFLPYGKAAQSWYQALDLVGKGQILQAAWKAGGGSIIPQANNR